MQRGTKAETPSGTATYEITVKDNDPPVADASPDKQALVDQEVTFDGSGSSDNIGIISYRWDFGDDSSATGITVSHAYSAEGTYIVTLTVMDAAGLWDTDEAEVTVTTEAAAPTMHVGDIVMSAETWTWWRWTRVRAQATVLVVDASGPLSNVKVYGHWSGAYNGRTVSGTTNGDGYVTFKTGWVWGGGTFTFTVDNLEKSGWEYDPGSDVNNPNSITAS